MATVASERHLTPDQLYDTLANDRRRACLRRIAATDGRVRVKDLAAALADRSNAEAAEDSVYISLIQVHMPKLAEYDIVVYDDDEQVVAPDVAFEEVMECLEFHETGPPSHGTVYRGVTLLTGLGLLGVLVLPQLRYPVVAGLLLIQVAGVLTTFEPVRDRLDGVV